MYRDFIAAFGDDIDAIAAAAPNDFEVSADEVAGFISETSAAPQPTDEVTFEEPPNTDLAFSPQSGMTIAPGSLKKKIASPRENAAAPSHDSAPKAATGRDMTHAEAIRALNAADMHLADCRTRVRATTAAVQDAKRLLQLEIEKHNAANPNRLTPEMNAKLYAQASLEERRQRVLRGATTGESARARAFVQKRMTGGGGRRNGIGQEARARMGFVVPGSPASQAPFDPQADIRARRGLSAPGQPIPGK